MIQVEHLTKRYAGHTAVDDLSFRVEKGEIVGFLGPNGAGKSTTMRILSCFLPATSGTARVAGHDVFTESLQVRQRLGYLPENVPLYTDMRVTEYLNHRAALKGLAGRRLKERVGTVKELTDIKPFEHKIIGKLSKGQRQRVGLAEAMVHEPELLILDEPTIGLDPNQIRQARELIRSLGERHTILLSPHILPEVEMTCSRVVIINKGRIAASDTPANLPGKLRSAGNIRLEADPGADDAAAELGKVPGVKEVTVEASPSSGGWDGHADVGATSVAAAGTNGFREFTLRVEAGTDPREEVYRLCVARRWNVRELSQRRATLEDVFVEITHADAH